MQKIAQQPSAQSVYFWNITGSMSNALASIVLLMLVTRILGTGPGDIFSIAWAICQMMLTVGTFQVRMYQATDVLESYRFHQYHLFRILTVGIMIAGTLGYTILRGYDSYKVMVIVLLCLVKAVDAFGDVYEGWFQQKERLDLAGKALTYRVLLSTAAFGLTIAITKNLLLGCTGMLAASIVCFLVFNKTYASIWLSEDKKGAKAVNKKWLMQLAVTCLPLFINAFLVMSIFNAPKMAIDTMIDGSSTEQGLQTIYGILFMPASVMNLAYIVFRPMITQMAIGWNNQDYPLFFGLIRRIFCYLSGIGILVMAGGFLLGIPVLSLIYGIDLKNYRGALFLLLLGGAVNTLVNVLDNALTVIRRQYILVIAYGITWMYAFVAAPILVRQYKILGASVSFLTSMLVLFLSTFILFAINVKIAIQENKREGDM